MDRRYRVIVELQDLEGAPDGYTVVAGLTMTFANLEQALMASHEAHNAVLLARAKAEIAETVGVLPWS